MKTLGISGKHRDAAAAVAVDGRVIAAASEDSFARVPHVGYAMTGGAPHQAIAACLRAAGVGADEIDEVVVVCEDESDKSDKSGERDEAAPDVPAIAAALPRARQSSMP